MSQIIEDLNWRYAVKQFDDSKKINESDFQILKESLRLTPTSYGLQAFKVLSVESPEIRERLVSASYGQRQVADASHLFVLCAYTEVTDKDVDAYMKLVATTRDISVENLTGFSNMIKGTVNSRSTEEVLYWTSKQTYIALGQLMHSCASLRIDATPMEGFDSEKFDEILGLKEKNLTATLACPVGYRHQDDKTQHTAKVRKSLDDLIETI